MDEFLHCGSLKSEMLLKTKVLYKTQHEAYASKMIQRTINLDKEIIWKHGFTALHAPKGDIFL